MYTTSPFQGVRRGNKGVWACCVHGVRGHDRRYLRGQMGARRHRGDVSCRVADQDSAVLSPICQSPGLVDTHGIHPNPSSLPRPQ